MKKSPLIAWLLACASEFVEGLADGFIISAGGAQLAIATASQNLRALTPQEIASSMVLAGIWYVAAYVKKNPPPLAPAPQPTAIGDPPSWYTEALRKAAAEVRQSAAADTPPSP